MFDSLWVLVLGDFLCWHVFIALLLFVWCVFVFYYFLFIYCYMREDTRNIFSLNAIHRSSVEDQNDEAPCSNLVSS